jgi:amino acid transporter
MAGFDDVKDPTHADTSVVASRRVYNEDVPFVDEHERNDLARGLKQRHVQMIAIAGAIVCYSQVNSFAGQPF